MTDKVKAALERYRPEEDYYEGIERDALTLADAYAAEHLADDDEPVTVAWLATLPKADVQGESRCFFFLTRDRWLDVYQTNGGWFVSVACGDQYAVEADIQLLNIPTSPELAALFKEQQ